MVDHAVKLVGVEHVCVGSDMDVLGNPNPVGGPDNITVIASRFDGDALANTRDDDSVGYVAFPLRNTLADDTLEARAPQAPFRSDPTPVLGNMLS